MKILKHLRRWKSERTETSALPCIRENGTCSGIHFSLFLLHESILLNLQAACCLGLLKFCHIIAGLQYHCLKLLERTGERFLYVRIICTWNTTVGDSAGRLCAWHHNSCQFFVCLGDKLYFVIVNEQRSNLIMQRWIMMHSRNMRVTECYWGFSHVAHLNVHKVTWQCMTAIKFLCLFCPLWDVCPAWAVFGHQIFKRRKRQTRVLCCFVS